MLTKAKYQERKKLKTTDLSFYLNAKEADLLWTDDSFRGKLLALCTWQPNAKKQLSSINVAINELAKYRIHAVL